MHHILDLDRYPLDRPGSPEWQALVAQARADLAANGMFNLEGFMRPEVIASVVADLAPKFDTESFTHARRHNIYFKKDVPGLAPDHPALRQFETCNRTLCGDQLDGPLTEMYRWPELATFIAATMEKPQLHPMADPLACVNLMSYNEGQALNWHFDRSEFTTTLLLQAPEAGGEFEYRSDLRSDDDPNYDGVAKLLAGEDSMLHRLSVTPGTLNVFKGKNTAHRVTPVKGGRARIITVLTYYERPGVRFTDEENIGFYGRAA